MDTIETQLWIVIVLLCTIVVGSIVRTLSAISQKEQNDKWVDFASMYYEGKYDELMHQADALLKKFPRHHNALYFSAQALAAQERYLEAKERLLLFQSTSPWMKDLIAPTMKDIDEALANNRNNNSEDA